jgi:hypothetical protein
MSEIAGKTVDMSVQTDKTAVVPGAGSGPAPEVQRDIRRRTYVANHLTPSELADETNMKRREVISKCMEMGVPIFNGRIDKTLFLSSLRQLTDQTKQPQAAH